MLTAQGGWLPGYRSPGPLARSVTEMRNKRRSRRLALQPVGPCRSGDAQQAAKLERLIWRAELPEVLTRRISTFRAPRARRLLS